MSWLVFAGVVLVGWVFAPLGSGSFADVMRASGAIWLLANGGVVHWQSATISLVPLLATVLIVLFQRRAGRWLVVAVDMTDGRSARAPLGYAIASAASVQALMAASIANTTLQVPLWRSLLGAALVAAVGFGWGVARTLELRVPAALRSSMRVAARFAAGMAAAALVLVAISAVARRDTLSGVLRGIASDRTSIVQVLVLCLAYVPTVIGWAMAFLLGPGFSVGAGTAVSLAGVSVSVLPPVPLLALIPDAVPASARVAIVIPALVAVWATRGITRQRVWLEAGLALLWTSAGAVLLANAVFGGIGPGRLSAVGPVWWEVTGVVAVWLAFGFVVHLVTGWAETRIRDARERKAREDEQNVADKLAT